jgi:propanol-preferring alcohol dehydrogenase
MMKAPPDWRPSRLPFTISHENAGWVEKLGPAQTSSRPETP